MKKILSLLTLFILSITSVLSQDIVVLNNNDTIHCSIQKVNDNYIWLKRDSLSSKVPRTMVIYFSGDGLNKTSTYLKNSGHLAIAGLTISTISTTYLYFNPTSDPILYIVPSVISLACYVGSSINLIKAGENINKK